MDRDKLFTLLDDFKIETPSWGYADTGTRFGKFLQAAAASTIDEKLADAGVVDAGGRGLCVVLDAAESAVTGRRVSSSASQRGGSQLPVAKVPTDDLTAGGPAYEVMYLLAADDDDVPALRYRLAPLGDSLVLVGGGLRKLPRWWPVLALALIALSLWAQWVWTMELLVFEPPQDLPP